MDFSIAEYETNDTYNLFAFAAVFLAGIVLIVVALARASVRERIRRAGWMRVAGWWGGVVVLWMCALIVAPIVRGIEPASLAAQQTVEMARNAETAILVVAVVAALAATAFRVLARTPSR